MLNCKFNWHSPRIKALQRIRSGSQYSQNKNESIDEQGIDMDLIRNQVYYFKGLYIGAQLKKKRIELVRKLF